MQWRPIKTAPRDGTFVLLRGGKESAGEKVAPAVVAFFDADRTSDGGDGAWAYAHWFGSWRSYYDDPQEWMPVPGASIAQWVEAEFNKQARESPPRR
jgi:hypothetical protein